MKLPTLMDRFLERPIRDIPNERPDLLQADARKRFIKAGLAGAFAVANYFASSRNYLPAIQPEAHIANDLMEFGGFVLTVVYGFTGALQRSRVEALSFPALDQQLEEQDDDESEPPLQY